MATEFLWKTERLSPLINSDHDKGKPEKQNTNLQKVKTSKKTKEKKTPPTRRVAASSESGDEEKSEADNQAKSKQAVVPFTPCEGHRGYVTVPSDQYTMKDIFKPVVFNSDAKRKRKAKSITDL